MVSKLLLSILSRFFDVQCAYLLVCLCRLTAAVVNVFSGVVNFYAGLFYLNIKSSEFTFYVSYVLLNTSQNKSQAWSSLTCLSLMEV